MFGTNKQKKALSSRKLNQVGSDILHQAVAKAASNVIDQKGLESKLNSQENTMLTWNVWLFKSLLSSLCSQVLSLFLILYTLFIFFSLSSALQQEVAETESQGDLALHLPPCDANADKPEDVYPLDERILHFALCVCVFITKGCKNCR